MSELTLIVAATRNMGIGANGSMPWQGLRKEMQYFARVTTRISPQSPPGSVNAVIMGRKTWDSIPPKFRPLKDRLNIVISRAHPTSTSYTLTNTSEPLTASSLEQALLLTRSAPEVSRVFVIGGAQIYAAAMEREEAKRVLLTSIKREYECDTFFPVELGKMGEGWERRSREELEEWTGEKGVTDGEQEEAGTKYEFQMWEKQ